MKKIACFFLVLLIMNSLTIYAAESINYDELMKQNQLLREELKKKELINSKLIKKISAFENKLNSEIINLKNENQKIANNLEKNKNDVSDFRSEYLRDYRIQNITFGGFIFILLIFISIHFVFYRNKFIAALSSNRNSLDHDIRLSELLSNQLKIIDKQNTSNSLNTDDDHALPIVVGNEIFRMRKRIATMEDSTKGVNALKNALIRLEDELNQKGYTIKDLSGQPYTEELTIRISNSIQRKDIQNNITIISRMIEPIIYHNGVVVSGGEAELALGA